MINLPTEEEDIDPMARDDAPAPPEVADAMSTSSKMSLKLGRELVVSNIPSSTIDWLLLVVIGGGVNKPSSTSLEGGCLLVIGFGGG